MRLFGTFKFIEAYLIICAILLLYSFQKLCKQEKISDVDGFLNHQGYLRLSDSVLKKVYKNESDTDAVDLGVVDVHRGPPDVPRDSYAINKSRVRGELNDVVVTLPPHEEEVVTDKFSRNGSEPVPARTVVADPVTTTHESLKKGLELEEEVQRHHHNPELMGKKLPKLDEDVLDVSTNASAEPAVDQGNHPVVEADKTPVALPAGIHFPPVDNELSSTKPLALTSEPPSSGVLNYFSDLFSSKARQRRNVDKAYDLWTKKPLIANQTSIGAYRCEKDAGLSFQTWWNDSDVYQTLFTKRFYAMGFLLLHLLFIIYHCIVNITHRIPTSQRFNRVFAAIGLIIWGLIDNWILYHYFTWRSEFEYAPFEPSFPDELATFAIISISMIALLIYELVTPMTIFTSYDVSPRHPRMGYVPAAQSENEYISGIINQLETSHKDQHPFPHHDRADGFDTFNP